MKRIIKPAFVWPPKAGRGYFGGYAGVGMNTTTSTPALDKLCVVPLVFPTAAIIDKLQIQVTTLASNGVARMGVYADNGDLYPGALLVDGGEVSTATTGFKVVDIADINMNAREVLWLTSLFGVAAPVVAALGTSPTMGIWGSDPGVDSAPAGILRATQGYGALPATFPVSTDYSTVAYSMMQAIIKA